jgi:hypothetical protein
MNKIFKKGDTVWSITDWDGKAKVCVKKLVIQSFGKIQGTAFDVNTNNMAKMQFYTNRVNHLFLVSDVANIQEFAMQKAIEQKAERIQHFVNCVHNDCSKSTFSDKYAELMKINCQAVMDSEPTVIYK